MDLSYLNAFYEVAQQGSFSKAAEKLHISTSALSRSVALLEESEGVQLFIRSKAGVKLTSVGTEVFVRCEKIFKTCKEIEFFCQGKRENCEGLLAFAAIDHILNYLLAEPLQEFLNRYPGLLPSVFTDGHLEVIEKVKSTDVEFGFTFTKVPDPQIDYKRIIKKPMAVVCHPRLWKESHSSSTEKTIKNVLAKRGYISSVGVHLQEGPSRVVKEIFGGMPKISFEVNSQESQKSIALAGGGIAFLSKFMVEKEIADGSLVEVPTEKTYSFNLWLLTRKGRELSLNSKTAIDFFEARLQPAL